MLPLNSKGSEKRMGVQRGKARAEAAPLAPICRWRGMDTHVGREQVCGLSQGQSQGSEGSRLKGRECDSLVVVVKLQDREWSRGPGQGERSELAERSRGERAWPQ